MTENYDCDYISADDIAKYLDCSKATVRRMIMDGRLPAINLGRGLRQPRYKVRRADFEQFMKDIQVKPEN